MGGICEEMQNFQRQHHKPTHRHSTPSPAHPMRQISVLSHFAPAKRHRYCSIPDKILFQNHIHHQEPMYLSLLETNIKTAIVKGHGWFRERRFLFSTFCHEKGPNRALVRLNASLLLSVRLCQWHLALSALICLRM